ncbi:hypothetical protein BJ508DRAFT_322394 [Ascobolus immersus RN42]|uniref:RING-type E3 ubiquitin transferase n=1 Tax=Ascobolus immersus RN42 TaxID=1160509 RepID=A0A3N4IK30_ASCIM|nr:hypothetical protein BJ508DRAFT_322394 [Ascobolus immersus RN42]
MEPPPISAILFFALLFFLTPSFVSRPSDFDDVISKEERQLAILQNSSYGKPGNLTGLEHVGHKDKSGHIVMMPPNPVRTRVKNMVKEVLGSEYELAHPDWDDKPKPAHQIPDDLKEDDSNDGRPLDLRKREYQDGKFPFWHNITSIKLHGPWSRETLPSLPPYLHTNVTLDRNITTETGMISFSVDEFGDGPVQDVKLSMMLMDPHDTKLFDVRLQGIHFVSTGDLILTSTSDRFAGIFGLPHFALSESAFNASKASVVASITAGLEKQKNTGMTVPSWQSTTESTVTPNAACDFITYLQIHHVLAADEASWYDLLPAPLRWLFPWVHTTPPGKREPYTPEEIALIESELRHRTGVPTRSVPPIEVSGVIYSPTCGYVVTVGKAKGLKEEVYFNHVSLFALLVGACVFWQIWGLIGQMKESSTPSTVSRVSIWSIGGLSLLDGYLACAFLGVGIVIESAFLPIMTAGFLTFIGSMVFGARFIYTIYQVQRPPRGSSTTPAPRAAPAAATTLPAPVTAPNQTPAPTPGRTSIFSSIYPTSPANQPPRPVTPVLIAPDQDANLEEEANQAAAAPAGATTPEPDDRQDALLLLSRSLLTLFATSFLFLHATSWSYPYRTYFFHITVTVLSSVWWPQVFRNVSRNARRGLSMKFVISQSVARVATFAGAMVLLGSVTGDGLKGTDWKIVLWVLTWVSFQILVLYSQTLLGGRWFLPSIVEKWGWVKGGFDYHCVLRREDLELLGGVENVEGAEGDAGSVRSGQSRQRRKEGGRCWFDCAICRESVGVPFIDEDDDFSEDERPRDEEEGGASDSLLGSSSSSSRQRRGRGLRRWFRFFARKGRKRDDGGGNSGGGVKERLGLQRKDYMVTPCRHVFHTECLEGWMRYRLQCPICRCALPAL